MPTFVYRDVINRVTYVAYISNIHIPTFGKHMLHCILFRTVKGNFKFCSTRNINSNWYNRMRILRKHVNGTFIRSGLVNYSSLPIGKKQLRTNNNDMFISYSWYNNESVQIQMENMPKNYNTHASYKSSTQSDEGTYSLVLQTICIFDITVRQYLITCNFPNQIRQFGWIKYWQVITIVFTCCELFYRSYSITCSNINSAGSVFAQIIIGAIP